jgi:hypothetical protein
VAVLTEDEMIFVTLPIAIPRSNTLDPTTRPFISGTAIERLIRFSGVPTRIPNDAMYIDATTTITPNAANDAIFFAVLMV